nr:DUF2946 family protein [Massilia brevitalea]
MMLVLPAQYSWSAAAAYCQHENGASLHFGHHAHEHKAQVGEADDDGEMEKAHADCEYCHLFSHAFFTSASDGPPTPDARRHAALGTLNYSSHIPEGPSKPDWHLVA